MVRIDGQLSPDHGALLRHAITALSSPSPETSCCDDPHHRHTDDADILGPDLRSPSKRRADALTALIFKAAELIDGDAAITITGTARLVVTMTHDRLLGAINRHCSTGLTQLSRTPLFHPSGERERRPSPRDRFGPPDLEPPRPHSPPGITDTEERISPALTRALACDAEIIPMVLGTDSEPLDVGRMKRLVPPGLRRAVIARDHHCTFPSCDRPPSWCQVHHVHPWQTGGDTSLGNSALLCQRHHTIVHRDGYTATVTPHRVTWDLTRPGTL